MNCQQVKHGQFQLSVNEYGVDLWIGNPESLATFLLVIAEAISNGFWIDGTEAAS